MTATAATEFTPQDVADFMRRHGCSEFYVQHYLRTMGRAPKEIDMTISHSILAAAKAGERAVEYTDQQRHLSDLIVKVPGGDWGPLGVEPSRNAVSPASTPRLCKDCKHAEAGAGVWMCGHPELLALDFVTGNHKAQHCATLRAPGPRPPFVRECGPDAQFWAAK